MATLAEGQGAQSYLSDQSFFVKLSWVMAILILFAFAQNAALGRVDIPKVPYWVHIHGLAMLTWLGLFVNQNRLAASGNIALHRKLGWVSAFVVCLIVGLTSLAGVRAVELHRQPPFFDPAFFLMLTQVGAICFGGLVFAAIVNRRDTERHRRLMAGATIILLDAALGRLVPFPLLGGEMGEWVTTALMMVFVALIAAHDRRTLGRVHPATVTVGMVVILAHLVIALAARSGPVIALAARLSGQG
ncbi:adenylate cyclase [Novosphingobium flavum]|uniref:Adenylate cyclase n=1 Tax=Novosphingobium flavum TaxID=1778672 RepID=A0A7X1FTL9_9SPHN|nr:adenylate cyclase [Novosphingobium flavum]MBC2666769.1 adenylate cyclase [Novosphingobium flavum]